MQIERGFCCAVFALLLATPAWSEDLIRKGVRFDPFGLDAVVFVVGARVAIHVKQVYRDFEVLELLELLDRFGSGISFAAQSNLPSAKTLLRAIAIDGVEPTAENVAGGRYGMVHRFGLLYKPTRLTDGAHAFMAFIRTNDGRRVIEQSGVAPLRKL